MRHARAVLIAGGLLVGAMSFGKQYIPKPAPPAPAVAAILDGISAADSRELRNFYGAMADIVVRDGKAPNPVCKTTFDLRNRHRDALQMAFVCTGMVGKYPGLGERLDSYLLQAVGALDLPLTPESREAAAKAFAAIR